MIFGFVLELEISYRVIIYLEGFWFLLEDFFGRLYVCMIIYIYIYRYRIKYFEC
jgi:hypothetical protein